MPVDSTKLKSPAACFPFNVWEADQLMVSTLCACRLLPSEQGISGSVRVVRRPISFILRTKVILISFPYRSRFLLTTQVVSEFMFSAHCYLFRIRKCLNGFRRWHDHGFARYEIDRYRGVDCTARYSATSQGITTLPIHPPASCARALGRTRSSRAARPTGRTGRISIRRPLI
jgi:hypothetical protein